MDKDRSIGQRSPFRSQIPELRHWAVNSQPWRRDGDYVLYWMTSQRRPHYNFSLQRAVEWARELGKPLVILEALRLDYPWARERFNAWVREGMAQHADFFRARPVTYYPFVGDGKGLLESLAQRACLVVGDYFPAFFLPHMLNAAAERLPVRLEVVDGNGVIPLRATPKAFLRAVDFRNFLRRHLTEHWRVAPDLDPIPEDLPRLQSSLPEWQRWPAPELASGQAEGGFGGAQEVLQRFLQTRLHQYLELRNQPALSVSSELSPYLHFGNISPYQVLAELPPEQGEDKLGLGLGHRNEAFLDQLLTWRELGYNMCHHRPDDYHEYASLPAWAQATLARHQDDPRPQLYSLEQLDQSQTYDAIWNAAQNQLRESGRMHNYLRMLWGKKIIEWSRTPQEALAVLVELNNRHALDGRNPNSYSGIFWCFGRYDRPWFERPIFGQVRYMSSQSTARKFNLKPYLARWS